MLFLFMTWLPRRSTNSMKEAYFPPFSALGGYRARQGLADALDAKKAVDDLAVGDGEVRLGAVDVGRQHLEAHGPRLADVLGELVGVGDLVGEVGGHELGRVVGLEVGGAVGDDAVGGSMGLVEAVSGEGDQDLEDAVGVGGLESVRHRALDEFDLLLDHDLVLLLPHRAPQEVGLSQAVAADSLGDLHDLLLVHDDPVGLLEDRLEAGVGIGDRRLARLGVDELRNVVHGARPIERVERYQVLHAAGLRLLEDRLHPARLELEDRGRLALAEQLVGPRIVLGDLLLLDLDPAPADEVDRMLDEGEGLEPEEVHLHEAALLEIVHRELRGHDARLRVLVQRHEVRQRRLADHDARRMETRVAVLVLELLGHGEEVFVPGFLGESAQLGLVLEGLGEGHLRVLGHELGDVVRVLVGDVEGAGHVLEHRLGLERAEGDDLPGAVRAVLARDVVDHLAATLVAEVDVEIGHRDALGVEETLEEQVVLEGVDVRDPQRIGHDAARARPAPGPDGDALGLRPVDEVPDDEEVARELHFYDDVELVLGPPLDLLGDDRIAPAEPREGEVAQVRLGALVLRRVLVVGEHRPGIGDLEIDHLRDPQRALRGPRGSRRRAPPSPRPSSCRTRGPWKRIRPGSSRLRLVPIQSSTSWASASARSR